jgi:hypothetical protein
MRAAVGEAVYHTVVSSLEVGGRGRRLFPNSFRRELVRKVGGRKKKQIVETIRCGCCGKVDSGKGGKLN